MSLKVADLIAEFLVRKNIRYVFGIVGAGNAHIFDAIARRGFTEIVCVHHEQAATMAMQTYYRTSGQMTACLLTTGGGSTNGVTGVVSAWMDSVPGIVISGNENSRFTRSDNPLRVWGVQGYDSVEMVRGVTKYAARVMDPASILSELNHAYDVALGGRPGPVWLDVPMNVQSTPIDAAVAEAGLLTAGPGAVSAPVSGAQAAAGALDGAGLREAVVKVGDLLRKAERPLFWLGNGIRLAGGVDRIAPLLERTQVPALVSWAGIDMVDSDHPLVYGRAGVYGQRAANFVLQNCDLVVAVGTRLAIPQVGYDMSEFARAAKLVVVDIDPDEAAKHGERVELPVCADARGFLDALLAEVEARPVERRRTWIAQCDQYRNEYPWVGPEHADEPPFINSYRFMERLHAHMKPDQVVVTDMGTALLSGHQVLKMKPGQRLMTSTGLGEMGYGLPAAIGASFARDRGEVLCLNCDGGMMMNLQELQTIVHHKLPIRIVIFNNDGYLMIKHTQKNLFGGRNVGSDQASGVSCPDFAALANAFGMPSFAIRNWEDFDRVMPDVQAVDGPVICEVFMHPQQLFVPKLSTAVQKDGSLVSPPLEDLAPLLPREQLRKSMIVGVHPKSESLDA